MHAEDAEHSLHACCTIKIYCLSGAQDFTHVQVQVNTFAAAQLLSYIYPTHSHILLIIFAFFPLVRASTKKKYRKIASNALKMWKKTPAYLPSALANGRFIKKCNCHHITNKPAVRSKGQEIYTIWFFPIWTQRCWMNCDAIQITTNVIWHSGDRMARRIANSQIISNNHDWLAHSKPHTYDLKKIHTHPNSHHQTDKISCRIHSLRRIPSNDKFILYSLPSPCDVDFKVAAISDVMMSASRNNGNFCFSAFAVEPTTFPLRKDEAITINLNMNDSFMDMRISN